MGKFPTAVWLIIIGLIFTTATPSVARNVIDQIGRKVLVPDNPQRVVAMAPSVTEIIFDIGKGHCLKGVTRFSDFPSEAQTIPKVGSYVHLNLEKIVALQPDLCIAINDGNPKEVADRLESFKIPVYVIDPKDLKTVMQTILEIGKLLNADTEADHLVQNMQSRIQQVQALVTKTHFRPRVFFQIGITPIVSAGTQTFIHELIEMAGGKNLAEGSIFYPRFAKEQVLKLAPEVFIITSMARNCDFERVKAEWSRWPRVPAVKNQRIFLVNSDFFDRPTPRLINGLELLLQLIHPELIEGRQPT
ncbi:MAG: cobalamin-binding protein [Desulfobacterales bacterium]|nr:cobalamin-binding protein [Desulfobacterales bacterium]